MPSKVPATIDYLVALFQGAATLGQASPAVTVIDGPKVTADPGNLALWVGVDDIAAAQPAAASSTQSRDGLGRRATEILTVHCVAQAKSGSNDVQPLRLAAAGIVAAAETLVAEDGRLGGAVAEATPSAAADWRQGPGPQGQGMAVQVMFTIDCKALPEP